MSKLYRPSNGTDGDIFMSLWCNHCAHYEVEEGEYCGVLGLTGSLFHAGQRI